ncbi:MAG: protoheme IX farnesyltransferase [Acidobacteriota bacterium]
MDQTPGSDACERQVSKAGIRVIGWKGTLPMETMPKKISLVTRWGMYGSLIKSLQTGLLLVTGLAGYMSARCPTHAGGTLLAVAGSLFLAISGSTVLNMVYDRDIDALMNRSCRRPLPSGRLSAREALRFGMLLSAAGLGWAFAMDVLYGVVVFTGWFFDVIVYTIALKRRTPWSMVWGGVAGGMPILAGRVLGTGAIDWIGLVLTLAITLWIPTHMLTFGMKHAEEYRKAGVPIFPNAYGEWITRIAIALSTAAAAVAMLFATWQIGLPWRYLHLALGLSAVLFVFTAASVIHRSPRLNFGLYKFASLYMLGSMLLIVLGVL